MERSQSQSLVNPAPMRSVVRLDRRRRRPSRPLSRLRHIVASRLYNLANQAEELGWKLER